MDILSFILGMSIVVVIAVAVVAVIAFVKVNRLNKEIESIHTIYSGEFERVNRDRTDSERQIYSVLDSRLDKLESKIKNNNNDLSNDMAQMNERIYNELLSLTKKNNLK